MAIFPGSAIPSAVSDYEIDNSLRFEDADNAFLYEVIGSSATNPLIWTLSFWTKIGRIANGSTSATYPAGYRRISCTKKAGADVTNMEMGFRPGDNLVWYFWIDGSNHYGIETTPLYRDEAAWYHFTLIFNAPDSTAADRMQIWVNGERQTATAYGGGLPPNDEDNGFTTNGWTRSLGASIGNVATPTVQYPYPGYLAEVYCIDGQALEPDSFGETDSDTNQWIPKEYTGTYGNNGFYLKFQDSAALGDDSSGNTNDFTVTNLVATDQMIDTPTNNFATINPLIKTYVVTDLSEGNLRFGGGSGWNAYIGTIGASSGKWYWEVIPGSTNFRPSVLGPSTSKFWNGTINPQTATDGCVGYVSDGNKQIDGTETSYGLSFAADDIIGVALDLDAGTPTVTFYKNDSTQGAIDLPSTLTSQAYVIPSAVAASYGDTWQNINFGQDSSFAGRKSSGSAAAQDANGKGDFYYAPPSGFLALCTDNLPSPEIALPGENFNTAIWTGDGTSPHAITGVGFTPDLFWGKKRASGAGAHTLVDSIRGVGSFLESNNNAAADTSAAPLVSFDSDGVTLTDYSNVNSDTNTFVAWNWKAGGAPTADNSAGAGATPTAGSVKVDGSNYGSALAGATELIRGSSNTTAGFSICHYEGDGTSSNSFAHLLSQAPEMIICKNLDAAYDWPVAYQATTNQATVYLDTTAATFTGSNQWNSSVPTSTLVNIGGSSETNSRPGQGDKIVAYCFHSVEGYSKVGSYAGNSSSTDGTFIYCGFKPAYVLNKMIEPHTYGWVVEDSVRDPYNAAGYQLYPDTNGAEAANHPRLDFLSNGFKWYDASYDVNHSTATYLFLAFAESPFKYSNAR